MNAENPLLSICCITYNQAHFIAQTLESFLMQETDFAYEIIVCDDASGDETPKIISEYAAKYPHMIKPVLREKNVGAIKNFTECILKANGEFIALCEGDDYWTDAKKLQKQVDFLRAHPEVSIVHTDFDWKDMDSDKTIFSYYQAMHARFENVYPKEIYLRETLMRTLTVCFRKSDATGFESVQDPSWTAADVPLFMVVARFKKIGYLSESTGVYRRSLESTSVSQNLDKQYAFWRGVAPIRSFFYDYYGLKDASLKQYLDDEYYKGLFFWSVQSDKYPFEWKSLAYKLKRGLVFKSDFKLIVVALLKKIGLHDTYQKLKKALHG